MNFSAHRNVNKIIIMTIMYDTADVICFDRSESYVNIIFETFSKNR